MYAKSRVLWAAHLAVFVALAELVRAGSVMELARTGEQFSGILLVLENDVIDSLLAQHRELVERLGLGRVDGVRELGGTLEPLDAFARTLCEAKFTVDLSKSEAVHRTRVRENCCAPI